MRMKPLAVIIAFLLWSAGSTYWYVCQIKGFCHENAKAKAVVQPETSSQPEPEIETVTVERELVSYEMSAAIPQIKDSLEWNKFVASLLEKIKEGKKIQITGPYYAGEPAPEGFENMGLARAEALKNLLADKIPADKMVLQAKLLGSPPENLNFVNAFEGYFTYLTDNDFVKEETGKTLIYFPYNSDKEIRNPEILKYLDELVIKLKENPDLKVEITGYTDNIGSPQSNKWLGLQRAKRIANLLIKKGVDKNRIIIKSGGEENPIADNSTPEGRKQNRRVEIKIIR